MFAHSKSCIKIKQMLNSEDGQTFVHSKSSIKIKQRLNSEDEQMFAHSQTRVLSPWFCKDLKTPKGVQHGKSWKLKKKCLIQTEWQTEMRLTRLVASQWEAKDISVILTVHLLESQTRGLMYLPGNKAKFNWIH